MDLFNGSESESPDFGQSMEDNQLNISNDEQLQNDVTGLDNIDTTTTTADIDNNGTMNENEIDEEDKEEQEEEQEDAAEGITEENSNTEPSESVWQDDPVQETEHVSHNDNDMSTIDNSFVTATEEKSNEPSNLLDVDQPIDNTENIQNQDNSNETAGLTENTENENIVNGNIATKTVPTGHISNEIVPTETATSEQQDTTENNTEKNDIDMLEEDKEESNDLENLSMFEIDNDESNHGEKESSSEVTTLDTNNDISSSHMARNNDNSNIDDQNEDQNGNDNEDEDEEDEEDEEKDVDMEGQESDADIETPMSTDYKKNNGITDGVTVTTLNQGTGNADDDFTSNDNNNNSNNNSLINDTGNETGNDEDQQNDNLGLNDEEEEDDEADDEDNDEEIHREKSTDFEASPSVPINESETTSPATLNTETTSPQYFNENRTPGTIPNNHGSLIMSQPTHNIAQQEKSEPHNENEPTQPKSTNEESTEHKPFATTQPTHETVDRTSSEQNNETKTDNQSISKPHTRQVEDGIIIPQTHEIVIPSYSTWFSLKKIHQIEKKSLPEFFTNRIASKTPEIYIKYRNFMVNSYRLNPNEYFSVTAARRNLSGDAASIFRIHKFLMKWGLINYQVNAKQLPKTVEPPYTNDFSTKHDAPRGIFPFESYKPSVQLPDMAKLKKMMDVEDERSTLHKYLSQEKKRSFAELEQNGMINTNASNNKENNELKSDNVSTTEERPAKRPNILDTINQGSDKIKWSREDLKKLLFGIQTYGSDWYKVAKHVGTKTPEQCVLRFLQLPIEDKFLYQDVSNLPRKNNGDKNTILNVNDLGPLKYAPHLPFSKSENPVLSTIAFLVGLVDPQIVQQMTDRAIRAMDVDNDQLSEVKENDKTEEHTATEKDVEHIATDENDKVKEEHSSKDETETKTTETSSIQENEKPTEIDNVVVEPETEKNAETTTEETAETVETKPVEDETDKTSPEKSENVDTDIVMGGTADDQLESREISNDNTDALFGDDNSDDDMLADEEKNEDVAATADDEGKTQEKEENKETETEEQKESEIPQPGSTTIETAIVPDSTTVSTNEPEEKNAPEEKPEGVLETLVEMRTSSKPDEVEKEEKITEPKEVASDEQKPTDETHEPEVVEEIVEAKPAEEEKEEEVAKPQEHNDVKEGSEIALASLGVRSHVFANNEERQMNKLANQMIQIQLEKLETKLKIFDKLERSLEFDRKKLERKQEEFLVQRLSFAKTSNLLVKKFDKTLGALNEIKSSNSDGTKKIDDSVIKPIESSVKEMKDLLSRPLYLSFGSKLEAAKSSESTNNEENTDLENGMKPISIENPQVYRYWSA